MAIREKVLIIGNGFDLYHELPTKYSQFIKVLMNIETLNIEDLQIKFDDLFKDVERNSEMKIRFDTEKMVFDNDKIIEIKNSLQNNCWYNSFKTKLNFENWIDVENEIKTTLRIIDKIIIEINKVINKDKNTSQFGTDWMYLKILNANEHNYLGFNFLIPGKSQIKHDLFVISNNFYINFKKEYFYDELFIELQTFINTFNIYLESIIGIFYKKIDSKNSDSLEHLKLKINLFYTFNYTPTLEKFYGIEKVNYLHGKHSLKNHNIVLGIDEVGEEFRNDKIFMFTKYYQKLFNNTDYEFLSEIKLNNSKYEDTERDFIVFGHSLADNDQNYLIELFEVVKLKSNTITILFYNLSDKAQKLKNLLKIIGRKDVEYLMKKKRLVFIEINDKPFETVFKSLPESFISGVDPSFH